MMTTEFLKVTEGAGRAAEGSGGVRGGRSAKARGKVARVVVGGKRKARVNGGGEGVREALAKAEGAILPAVGRGKKLRLGDLSAEQKRVVVLAAQGLRLMDLVESLEGKGVEISLSTFSRHLNEWRGEASLEDGVELVGAAEKFVARGKAGALREGAVEALRQQMFEGVLTCNSRKERMELFELLIGEETRIRKLAVEERKAAANERALELQAERLRVAGGMKVILELVKLMGDKAVAEERKLAAVREALERWKEGAIEVGGKGKRLELAQGRDVQQRQIQMTNDK